MNLLVQDSIALSFLDFVPVYFVNSTLFHLYILTKNLNYFVLNYGISQEVFSLRAIPIRVSQHFLNYHAQFARIYSG